MRFPVLTLLVLTGEGAVLQLGSAQDKDNYIEFGGGTTNPATLHASCGGDPLREAVCATID